MIEAAFRALYGVNPTWSHRVGRDTRTLFDLANTLAAWNPPEHATAHTALVDATAQAKDVCSAYAALRAAGKSAHPYWRTMDTFVDPGTPQRFMFKLGWAGQHIPEQDRVLIGQYRCWSSDYRAIGWMEVPQ